MVYCTPKGAPVSPFSVEQLSEIMRLAKAEAARHHYDVIVRCLPASQGLVVALDRARLMDTIADRAEGLLMAAIVEPDLRFIRHKEPPC
jgi:hypothetical protein